MDINYYCVRIEKLERKIEEIERWFFENYGHLGSFHSTHEGEKVIGDYFELKEKYNS